jgi:hypothetical protein
MFINFLFNYLIKKYREIFDFEKINKQKKYFFKSFFLSNYFFFIFQEDFFLIYSYFNL